MPAELQKSQVQVADGPLILAGEELVGIVVKDTYVFSAAHDTASDVEAHEVEPASLESRLTGTASVDLADDNSGWLVTITGTTAIDLTDVDDRGGIVWVRPNDNIVGFSEDIGPEDAAYLPTWPDGLFFDGIESIDDLLGRTVAGIPFDDDGNVPADTLAAALGIEGAALPAVLFAENLDASGGSFTDVVLYGVGEAIPRAYLVGADMLVVEGDDLATIWTITASGPCTVALEVTPGLVIGSASSSQGLVATAVTADGTNVTGWVIQATEAYARAQAFEGENALRYATHGAAPARLFDLGAVAFSEDWEDRAWTTPKPASFSGGVWIEALVTVQGLRLPASPSDGDTLYSEIATQTADGIGNWDAFEFAVQGTYSAATGRWTFVLFWEHTSSGASGSEDYQMSGIGSLGWSFTVGVPTRVAVWVDFTDGTSSTGYLLREAPTGGWSDLTAAGRNWRIVTRKIDAPTDIDTTVTEPWGIGHGHGAILTDQVVFRNGGPSGTIEASPSAADAYAAGDAAFADAQTNTWTPGSAAATTPGTGAPARIVNTDGDPGVTIYVGTVDPATDYSPVAGDVWIEP